MKQMNKSASSRSAAAKSVSSRSAAAKSASSRSAAAKSVSFRSAPVKLLNYSRHCRTQIPTVNFHLPMSARKVGSDKIHPQESCCHSGAEDFVARDEDC